VLVLGAGYNACSVPAIILQTKMQSVVERFTLTAKYNAFPENVSFYVEREFKMK